jgi:hypothetical protein
MSKGKNIALLPLSLCQIVLVGLLVSSAQGRQLKQSSGVQLSVNITSFVDGDWVQVSACHCRSTQHVSVLPVPCGVIARQGFY